MISCPLDKTSGSSFKPIAEYFFHALTFLLCSQRLLYRLTSYVSYLNNLQSAWSRVIHLSNYSPSIKKWILVRYWCKNLKDQRCSKAANSDLRSLLLLHWKESQPCYLTISYPYLCSIFQNLYGYFSLASG